MDYKTRKAYNQYPNEFAAKFKTYAETDTFTELADMFLKSIHSHHLLDLGCGPGIHASYFMQKGLKVYAVDFSENMLRLCKEKSVNLAMMDIEHIGFKKNSFDGVWAHTSLVHIRKSRLDGVINTLSDILKPQGLLYLSLKEGNGESYKADERYPGVERYWAYYTDEEVTMSLSKYFKRLHFSRTTNGKSVLLNYILTLARQGV